MKFLLFIVTSLFLGGCTTVQLTDDQRDNIATHQVIYTKVGMWVSRTSKSNNSNNYNHISVINYSNKKKIYTPKTVDNGESKKFVLYGKLATDFIPNNSPVIIHSMTGSSIKFSYNNASYVIDNSKRYSGVDIQGLYKRTFAQDTFDLSSFSEKEKQAIQVGKVRVGMSKEATIASRGYPPIHKTPSLEGSQWRYWIDTFDTVTYEFKDNKLTNIID